MRNVDTSVLTRQDCNERVFDPDGVPTGGGTGGRGASLLDKRKWRESTKTGTLGTGILSSLVDYAECQSTDDQMKSK